MLGADAITGRRPGARATPATLSTRPIARWEGRAVVGGASSWPWVSTARRLAPARLRTLRIRTACSASSRWAISISSRSTRRPPALRRSTGDSCSTKRTIGLELELVASSRSATRRAWRGVEAGSAGVRELEPEARGPAMESVAAGRLSEAGSVRAERSLRITRAGRNGRISQGLAATREPGPRCRARCGPTSGWASASTTLTGAGGGRCISPAEIGIRPLSARRREAPASSRAERRARARGPRPTRKRSPKAARRSSRCCRIQARRRRRSR